MKFSASWPRSTSIPSRPPGVRSLKPMALPRTLSRSSPSTMTEIFSGVRLGVLGVAAAIAIASTPVRAQQIPAVSLTLGDAARPRGTSRALSHEAHGSGPTKRNPAFGSARRTSCRRSAATSRKQAARSTLLRSGIDFPTPPGQPPVFDPKGQVEGPVNTLNVRGRIQQNLVDFGALGRVRSARAAARSSSANADAAAEQAATIATNAYVRAMRADADLRARQADSLLATELLGIAQAQLQAGTGVGLNVTRARSQLAATRASVIASRTARDHAHIDLLRSLALPIGSDIVLADSLTAAIGADLVPDEAALVAQAMRNRPDILAEEQRVRAAQQGLSAIKAERLPHAGPCRR